MKHHPRKELIVLKTIEELGLASIVEILAFIKEDLPPMNLKFDNSEVFLICERWKAKDLLSIDLAHGEKRYKIAAIPPSFKSCNMQNIVGMKTKKAKAALAEIETLFPEPAEAIKPPKGRVGDYVTVEILFETIDPILGGTPSDEGMLKLRRDYETGLPCITPAQFKGWVRSNGLLVKWNANARSWIAYSLGLPVEEPKLIMTEAPIVAQGKGRGIQKYEAFAPGTKIKATWRIPLKGQGIKGPEDIKELFDICSFAPRRGLGANPYYHGGRVKLLEMKQVST